MKLKVVSLCLCALMMGALLSSCGNARVAAVKKGVLGLDKSRTVEQAFDAVLDDAEWSYLETEQNQQVVQVTGKWKENVKFGDDVKLALRFVLPVKVDELLRGGDVITAQFVLNQDNTFELAYGEICDAEGKLKEWNNLWGSKMTAASNSVLSDGLFLKLIYQKF